MDWIKENPVDASGVAKAAGNAAKARADRRRKDYTKTELHTIVSSPLFTTAGWSPPSGRLWTGAVLVTQPALLHGRPQGRTLPADRQGCSEKRQYALPRHPVPGRGRRTPHAARRTVKTESSRRRVPIHDDLVALGLLDYARALPQDDQLFPLLKGSPAGFFGANVGKAWAKYLRELGELQSPASPSHGFRHTLKTSSRRVNIPEEVHGATTVHDEGKVSRDYGSIPLSRMAEEMNRLPSLPGLLGVGDQSEP